MTPIPLTLPDGTLHAWACGRCKTVNSSNQKRAWCYADVEWTFREAQMCCTCHTCRVPVEVGEWSCAQCSAKSQADRAVQEATAASAVSAHESRESETWRAIFVDGERRVEVEVSASALLPGDIYTASVRVESCNYFEESRHGDATRAVVNVCDEIMRATEWSLREIVPP